MSRNKLSIQKACLVRRYIVKYKNSKGEERYKVQILYKFEKCLRISPRRGLSLKPGKERRKMRSKGEANAMKRSKQKKEGEGRTRER